MTPRIRRRSLAIPLSLSIMMGASAARAEVFAVPDPAGHGAQLRVAPAGADGRLPWTPIGLSPDPAFILNPGGDGFGDEAPVAAFDALSGFPFVAWAARTPGGDKDIHLAFFDGFAWTDLGSPRRESARDDVSPALVVADGTPLVAWVERGPDRGRTSSVWYARYSAWGWSAPVLASPGDGSWQAPSLLLTSSEIVLGFTNRSRKDGATLRMIALPRYETPGTLATDGPMPVPPGVKPPGDNGGGSNLNP